MTGMGVLYDYFRAADDGAAIALMDDLVGGPSALADNGGDIDVVDLKGLDFTVILGQLVALARGVPWHAGLVGNNLIWSGDDGEGPWLLSLDDATRDTLASIDDSRLPELSTQWGQIEELSSSGPPPKSEVRGIIELIAGLAKRARHAGDHLYCWCSL
ncbi:hypothetical protein O7627_14295 [Solwaraspora sp. WMMD1047]|uniref:hypothetical protein n=1 Tax=Solwaraspora sp. WMMD1047 TaxID=3016102 RepID=UPI00241753E5|nr:hypothetical protein [Solwaraspora sp. WMMD1047]MDG4830469.1 hypothetical protein [Solwaraspora sp. WMMD1047]